MIVYGVRDTTLGPGGIGDVAHVTATRPEAEAFLAEVAGDEPDTAARLEIVAIELDGDSRN
jgi:hypothetical protein